MKKTIQCHSTKTSELLKIPVKNENYTKVKSISDIHNFNSRNKIIKNQNELITLNKEKKKHILLNNNNLNQIHKQNKPNPFLSTLLNKNLNKNNIQIQKSLKTNNNNKKEISHNKLKKNYPKVTIDIESKFSIKNTSYSKTAASTGNNNNPNDNIKNIKSESIFKNLIKEINIRDTQSISKIESLKNNIFLIKIYSFISNLISKNYKSNELENNLELKNQFKNFVNKLDLLSNSKSNNINIINADLFDDLSNFHNVNNIILHESNTRKLIYKTFFDFFNEILDDIVRLSNELSIQNNSSDNRNSLKKMDDLTSKISSLHSKINLSKNNNIDYLDSPVFSTVSIKNNFSDEDNNCFFGIEKDGSQLISSFEDDFYQQIIKKTFSKESSNSIQNQVKKIYINTTNKNDKNSFRNKSSSSSTIIQNDDFSDSEIIINESQFGSINSKSIKSIISRRSNSNKQSKKSLKINDNTVKKNNKRCESSKNQIRNSIKNIPIPNLNNNKLSNQIVNKNVVLKQKIVNPINKEKKDNDNCSIF